MLGESRFLQPMDLAIQRLHHRTFPERTHLACRWEGSSDRVSNTEFEARIRELCMYQHSVEADTVMISVNPVGGIESENVYTGKFYVELVFTVGIDFERSSRVILLARGRNDLYDIMRSLRMMKLISNKEYSRVLPMSKDDGPVMCEFIHHFSSDGEIVLNGSGFLVSITCWKYLDEN